MAKNCPLCNTPIVEGGIFCPECGARVSYDEPDIPEVNTTKPIYTPFVNDTENAQGEDAAAEAADSEKPEFNPIYSFDDNTPPIYNSSPPRRKRLSIPSWAKTAVIAVVLAIVLFAALKIALSKIYTPERAVNRFIAAMDKADLGAFTKTVYPADPSIEFTEKTVRPLFDLYTEDTEFRSNIKKSLLEDAAAYSAGTLPLDNKILYLTSEKNFMLSHYYVAVNTCSASIYTNAANTEITIGDQTINTELPAEYPKIDWGENVKTAPNIDDLQRCQVSLSGLLPGRYDVGARYVSFLGEEFTSERHLDVTDLINNSVDMAFDYVSVWVSNTPDYETKLYIDGEYFDSLDASGEYYITPISKGREIKAECVSELGDTVTDSMLSGDSPYFYVTFDLYELRISNEYAKTIVVKAGDKTLAEIAPGDEYELRNVTADKQLSLTLKGIDVIKPYEYTTFGTALVEPEFSVSDTEFEKATEVIKAYVDSAFGSFENMSTSGLDALRSTEVTETLSDIINDLDGQRVHAYKITDITFSDAGETEIASDSSVSISVNAVVYYDYTLISSEGTEEITAKTIADTIKMEYKNGKWSMADLNTEQEEEM